MIERAEGTDLIDGDGRRYIDGVSSLWCNVHGHRHAGIDAALGEQLGKVAHTTMLGLSHPGGAELAGRLVELAPEGLSRVFYSESGSTATEIALKMAFQYQQQRGGQHARRTSFVHLRDSYHGDTIGSVSVGGIDLFHSTYRPLLFRTHAAEPGDAADLERVLAAHEEEIAAVIVEPLVQGAAGMLIHPPGYLRAVRELCDGFGVLLICDEVATGFGRTGTMFACEQEEVVARPALPRQGPDRRLPAAGGDAGDRADLRGLPRRPRGVPHLLPRPHLHRQPARLRRRARQPRRLRERADDRAPAAEDRPAAGAAGRGRGDARGRRGPRPRLHGRDRPRRARPGPAPGSPRHGGGPRARSDHPAAQRRRRPHAPPLDLRERPATAWSRSRPSRSARRARLTAMAQRRFGASGPAVRARAGQIRLDR